MTDIESDNERIRRLQDDVKNLMERNIKLREALRPFMCVALEIPADWSNLHQLRLPSTAEYPTVGDYRRARQVLEG